MNNTNQQAPATTNQIQVERPNVKKTTNILPCDIAGSMNGGHYRVINCIPVMQGQEVHALRGQIQFQTLTPISPAYQKILCTIIAAWCPHSAVWDNWEEFYAQKGGTSVDKIAEMPNFGGKYFAFVYKDSEEVHGAFIYNTQQWRDSWISSYIARPGRFENNNESFGLQSVPALSALGPRGYVRIYNDLLRNKEYDDEIPMYKGDTVTMAEYDSYMPYDDAKMDFYYGRAKRDNSYYTNYRTELQGIEASYPPENMSADSSLISWMSWEQNYSSAKKQALDSQRNAWEIMAEERGSTVALQGKPSIIGKKSFYLNYSSITQNAYNNNEQIEDKYRTMGYQGAFSYTNIDMPLLENFKAEEEGNIHLIALITAESVFTSGYNRQYLNIKADEIYRPELAENKHDVLYKMEMRSSYSTETDWENSKSQVIGFKRRYSEYFSLPNNINGDMTDEGYFITGTDDSLERESATLERTSAQFNSMIDSNSTYTFYENNPDYYKPANNTSYQNGIEKKIWRDYTDIQLNKNMAIPNMVRETKNINYHGTNKGGSFVDGQHQIFYVGKLHMITTLPVDEAIKNDFLKWGEH